MFPAHREGGRIWNASGVPATESPWNFAWRWATHAWTGGARNGLRSSTATVFVRRHQTLDSDSPSKFAPQDGNSFHLRLSGEEEFVTFYSIGFHETYEMYFDLS